MVRTRSHVLLSLAELRERQGRLDAAIELVEQSLELARNAGERRAEATGHEQLRRLRLAQLLARDPPT